MREIPLLRVARVSHEVMAATSDIGGRRGRDDAGGTAFGVGLRTVPSRHSWACCWGPPPGEGGRAAGAEHVGRVGRWPRVSRWSAGRFGRDPFIEQDPGSKGGVRPRGLGTEHHGRLGRSPAQWGGVTLRENARGACPLPGAVPPSSEPRPDCRSAVVPHVDHDDGDGLDGLERNAHPTQTSRPLLRGARPLPPLSAHGTGSSSRLSMHRVLAVGRVQVDGPRLGQPSTMGARPNRPGQTNNDEDLTRDHLASSPVQI